MGIPVSALFLFFAIVWLATVGAAGLLVRYLVLRLDRTKDDQVTEITRLHALYATVIEQAVNAVQYGSPRPQPARVEDREPDAEVSMRTAITENMISRGVERLRLAYAESGQFNVPDNQLRAEVQQMLMGTFDADQWAREHPMTVADGVPG